jgi:hypothetical protein
MQHKKKWLRCSRNSPKRRGKRLLGSPLPREIKAIPNNKTQLKRRKRRVSL